MGHDTHGHQEEKKGFVETCYTSGESGVFAFLWTIIALISILIIVIFG